MLFYHAMLRFAVMSQCRAPTCPRMPPYAAPAQVSSREEMAYRSVRVGNEMNRTPQFHPRTPVRSPAAKAKVSKNGNIVVESGGVMAMKSRRSSTHCHASTQRNARAAGRYAEGDEGLAAAACSLCLRVTQGACNIGKFTHCIPLHQNSLRQTRLTQPSSPQ